MGSAQQNASIYIDIYRFILTGGENFEYSVERVIY